MNSVRYAALRLPLLLISSFSCLPGTAAAASLSWTGAVDDDWANSGNWSPSSSTPSSSDSVLIDQSILQTVMVNASASADDLTVGSQQSGSLKIVQSFDTFSTILGLSAGSSGTVEISGATGLWTNSGSLTIGDAGTGYLLVDAGGQYVGTGAVYLGLDSQGIGTLSITGGSSSASIADELFVGYAGGGALEVTAAATLETADATIAYRLGSSGEVSLSGAGSLWTVNGDLTVGSAGDGTLTISTGAELITENATIGAEASSESSVVISGLGSSWISDGLLTVGADGAGSLSMYSGAEVSSVSAAIGLSGDGSVTVGGSGSLWETGALLLGGDRNTTSGGTGTLDISAGGQVESTSASVGDGLGGTGSVTVDGLGSLWDVDTTLTIGGLGEGSLSISNAANVDAQSLVLGEGADSSGSVVIAGTGSTLQVNGDSAIGVLGSGDLKVVTGGVFSTDNAYLASNSGSEGTALVSGDGSWWDIANELDLGGAAGASASLSVSAGGLLTSSTAIIGLAGGSTGSVVVTGNQSSWYNSNDIVVADAGNGELDVILGGTVTSQNGVVGNLAGSVGTVFVSGDGSLFAISDDLYVGNGGTGTVTVSGGATLSASDLYIAALSGSVGTVNIGAALGQTAGGSASLDVDAIHFGDGAGSLVFNFGGAEETIDASIDGTGEIYVAAGSVRLTGDASGFDGTTTVSGGSLYVDGILSGSLVVNGYGTLAGTGTVGTTVLESGATISPGDDGVGTLSVDGDLTFESGSTYQVDADQTQSDSIEVSGAITINGGTLSLIGSHLSAFQSYTILTASGGVSGAFDNISSDYAFVDAVLDYTSSDMSLTLERNNVAFSDVAATRNQSAVAASLESLGISNSLYDAISVLSAGEARSAFGQLGGALHASLTTSSFDNSRFLRDAGLGRLRAMDSGALANDAQDNLVLAYDTAASQDAPGLRAINDMVAKEDQSPISVWSQAYGGWSRLGGSETDDQDISARSGGLVVGVDTSLADTGITLGALAAYGRSTFDQTSASASSDDYSVGVYAGSKIGHLAFRTGAIYTAQDLATDRTVAFSGYSDQLTSSYWSQAAQVFGEVGYGLEVDSLKLEPFANLAYVNVRTGGFSEAGGDAALSSGGSQSSVTYTTLGMHADTALALSAFDAALYGTLAWRYASGDLDSTETLAFSSGSAFTSAGVPLSRNSAIIEAGVNVALSHAMSLDVSYTGALGGSDSSQMVRGTLRARF